MLKIMISSNLRVITKEYGIIRGLAKALKLNLYIIFIRHLLWGYRTDCVYHK